MGNRFPGAGQPRGWWCRARLCPRSSPPCGEGGTHPTHPVSPVPKALWNWERFHAAPKEQVLNRWRGGSSAGLCAEHDVLLSVCDIHAYKCTLVRAASKKMQIKEHPVPPQGYPKAQLSPAK